MFDHSGQLPLLISKPMTAWKSLSIPNFTAHALVSPRGHYTRVSMYEKLDSQETRITDTNRRTSAQPNRHEAVRQRTVCTSYTISGIPLPPVLYIFHSLR
ncbi:hypothetical protein GE21DRAFT_1342729 [Neurospora crassa]|nr:hypothetical protein GE21DRAFT_1342729 [Neurospora crassa]